MAEERKKLAIIDGKSVFYRGYYAMPNLSTRDGVPTGGVYGFAAMALELIKKLKPDYVAVAWDKPKTNIRRRVELYPEYKAGRKAAPPDFYTQIPILHELLEAFGWPLYELDDYEADDIMGALAVQARKKNIETQLVTSDLDALQLINGHVKVYALKRGFSNIEEFHPESFTAKYGIQPEQFLDLKALKGDSSDNIPGVPGVGEKTAIELLKEYETLDGVYKNLPNIKENLRVKLEAGKESAFMSKEIARLWTDAPVKLDLKATDVTKLDAAHLQALLQKLEFRSLLNNLPEHMRAAVPAVETLGGAKLELPKNVRVESDDKLKEIKLPATEQVFVHSRSSGKHGRGPQVLMLSANETTVYTLDLTKLSPKAVTSILSPKIALAGYDVKSTLKLLIELGSNDLPEVKHDVLVAAYLLNSLIRAQSLNDLAVSELRYDGSNLDDLDKDELMQRAPEIMAVIRGLYERQTKEFIEMPTIAKLAQKVEWPLTPVLANMEYTGIKLDTAYLKKFSKQIEDSISELEQKIYGHADQEFNIGSPGQLADVLFVKLNLPRDGIKKGKTGLSTAANELAKLRGLHPIIDLITQYREVVKLKNTYIDTLPAQVDKNSRLHTTFSLTIAPTGRLSSADPNLQNIPVKTELGKNIRTAFVAGKGNLFVSADYSQFELRLAAALSGDKSMIEAFNKDEDIHTQTAAQLYDVNPDKVTKAQRSSVKAVNFGIMYGLGPHSLSDSTGMSFGEARDFISRYFEIRPKLKQYIEKTRELASEQGYVETIMGRRRPTPDVKSPNFAVREAAYRAAINHPMQGSAADIMKLAMVEVANKLDKDCRMLLQIHDSILLEVPKAKANKVGKLVKDTMEKAYPKLDVKLKADIAIGQNWGEL
ncbi:MAG TPA: DNA polymerase I [Candidatus Saccharimonadales bacterium]|nr:DNA polymerase I [Candidatus Saccharimonadales bacterium]